MNAPFRKLLLLVLLLAAVALTAGMAWVTMEYGPTLARPAGVPSPSTPAPPVSLQPVRANSVAQLEGLFERRDYPWPPAGTVPPLAVQALPPGLEQARVERKKRLFFRALLPLVVAENAAIARHRAFLRSAFAKAELSRTAPEWYRVRALAERYQLKGDLNDPAVRRRLLRRVDVVPPGLALAQAANESAWGTSRFTRVANNLFGQWTYDAAEGVVPKRRREGASHYVRVFPGLRASVRAYLHNINVGHAYSGFRQMRAHLRASGQPLDPLVLAGGLARYSQRGWDYVAEIRAMIRYDGLADLNGVRLEG